jgi:hypothetical protein
LGPACWQYGPPVDHPRLQAIIRDAQVQHAHGWPSQ